MHVEKLTSLTLFDAYPHIAVSGQRILIPSDNVMTLVWDTLIWRTNLISRLSYDFGQFLYYYDYFGSCSLLGYHVKCFWVAAPSFGGVSVIINNQTHPHLLCRLKSARLLPQSNTMRRYTLLDRGSVCTGWPKTCDETSQKYADEAEFFSSNVSAKKH